MINTLLGKKKNNMFICILLTIEFYFLFKLLIKILEMYAEGNAIYNYIMHLF